MFQYKNCSKYYEVKKLDTTDLDAVYQLCISNPTYYQKMHTKVTLDSVQYDMTNFPPDKTIDDKYFLGYFKNQRLIAIMDLILDYPALDWIIYGGSFIATYRDWQQYYSRTFKLSFYNNFF